MQIVYCGCHLPPHLVAASLAILLFEQRPPTRQQGQVVPDKRDQVGPEKRGHHHLGTARALPV